MIYNSLGHKYVTERAELWKGRGKEQKNVFTVNERELYANFRENLR